jgi:CheY-like chemotaxis protein
LATSSERTRVLVVDDEQAIASMLASLLASSGYETSAVFGGKEAIHTARTFRPDLLLTDYEMPDINGLQAASEIKRILPGMRIVLLTGRPDAERASFLDKPNYNFNYLLKPIEPDLLLKVLSEETTFDFVDEHPLVLNVDDVEEHRYSITRLLQRAGFRVVEAENASAAWKKVVCEGPHLVLLHINLPDLDGYTFCQQLKSDSEFSSIPVAHFTASHITRDNQERSQASGADLFLTQPIEPAVLVRELRSLLQLKTLQRRRPA